MKLYIDPGTGSMLFTILIGVIGAAIYSLRMLLIQIRFRLSGGKVKEDNKIIPLVIFSDNKRYWNIFEPICRELNEINMPVVYMTASSDDPVFSCAYPNVKAEFIGEGNRAFARLNYLNAKILLSTTPGLDVYQWKRSRGIQYYVHIPHAANDITLYRMFGLDYYDAVLLSGDYQIESLRKLERMRNLPAKEMVKVGIPYMDEIAKRYQNAPAIQEHQRTILLAPSWGPSAILNKYGSVIIDALLSTGYHVIIRPHPQSFTSEKEMIEQLMKAYPESEQLEWNRDNDNFNVLQRSDIMISDFSGVIFDFVLVQNKPVIYTDPQFDLGVYDAWWIDEPLWTVSALERIGWKLSRENMNQLKKMIDECLEDPQIAENIQSVKDETWAFYGEGAKRVAQYLQKKSEELNGGNK